MEVEDAVNPWEHLFRLLGNNNYVMSFWAITGAACTTAAPWFVVKDTNKIRVMWFAFLSVSALYACAWKLREKSCMHARRGWMLTTLFNNIMTFLAWLIVCRQHVMESEEWIWFWILIAIAFACSGWDNWRYFIGIACLEAFCTVWQPFYMKVFEDYVAKKEKKPEEVEDTQLRTLPSDYPFHYMSYF